LIGEYLFPKDSHSWVILEINNRICVVRKSDVFSKSNIDFGDLFLEILPRWSLAYKLVQATIPNIETVRYEWLNEIEYKVDNFSDQELIYFNSNWTFEMYKENLHLRTLKNEFVFVIKALVHLFISYLRKGFRRN